MLVTNTLFKNMATRPMLLQSCARFARKNKRQDNQRQPALDQRGQDQQSKIEDIKFDQKLINKTAALYDHYVKSRQRTMLTLDNYNIKFIYIIERAPIFLPYNPRMFDYTRTKYQILKKTGYYPQVPKQLQIEKGDYLFGQYQRINAENQITHRNIVSKTEVYEYAENSRYWKYTDPTVTDPRSVQAYSSDNVFLIVKNRSNGKWEFPNRVLTEKDNLKQIFTVMNLELFAGAPNPIVHMCQTKPIYARKTEQQSLDRGKGYYQYFFKGLSINGIPQFPTENYLDFAWAPKPHLSKYFQDDYFKETIKLSVHIC